MKRRAFIAGLGSAAAWPMMARAQQQPAMPKVGYVWIGERGNDVGSAGLRQGLVDKGYVIGRNLALEERYAHGDIEKVPALIAELLALKVDVLVTAGTPISLAARGATSTVPIVFISGDPVGAALVESLSHPGGNTTGLSLLSGDYSAKWLELLKEIAPGLRRIAALWNPNNQGGARQMQNMREAAPKLGLELTAFSGQPADVEGSFTAIAGMSVEGLLVTDDPFLDALVPRIVAFSAQRRVPALFAFSTAVQQGGLMSYSADFFALWRRGASYVERILKGARPADLPVEQATAVVLKINLKTAKARGLEIPPQLLARADEVIE
jgi:putative tryptophan/tyrosine transport system substrate-binding protein